MITERARPVAGVRCSARLTFPSAARTHPRQELGVERRRCENRLGLAGSLAVPTLVPRARSVSLAATDRVHPTGGTPPGVTPLERPPQPRTPVAPATRSPTAPSWSPPWPPASEFPPSPDPRVGVSKVGGKSRTTKTIDTSPGSHDRLSTRSLP